MGIAPSMCVNARLAALALAAGVVVTPAAHAEDAPLFFRPFNGVPISNEMPFVRIIPESWIDSGDDHLRQLDPGGGPDVLPPNLPPRFTDLADALSTTGMSVGMAYFGQFIDHDADLTRERNDAFLLPPFVKNYVFIGDLFFQNRRTPGFDLDPLYRIHPLDYPSDPSGLGPWDIVNLKFRFVPRPDGALDFFRGAGGIAVIGDARNDITGAIGQIHRSFMKLHNLQVDRIVEREGLVYEDIEYTSDVWWDVFNEARNYTTAYFQGILCNQYAPLITGRTIFEAETARRHPIGPLVSPHGQLEFAEAGFRLHTTIPNEVRMSETEMVSPISESMRHGTSFRFLFGAKAQTASRIDLGVAPALRDIVGLFIPGNPIEITLDLVQVNILRGREVTLPSGEEYLAFLIDELELDPAHTQIIRNKSVLFPWNAAKILDPRADADLIADLEAGDTDLHPYILLEAELNDGVLGPVGQDVFERTVIGLLQADDFSLLGRQQTEFTREQMTFFRTATFERMLEEILQPEDVNQDLIVNARDLAELLAHWGSSDPATDINGDGIVDASDLALLINAWGY